MSVTSKRTEQTKEANEALKRAGNTSPQEAAAALRELEETARQNAASCRTFERKHPHYRNTGGLLPKYSTGAPEMYETDADAYGYAAALVELGELSEAGEFLGNTDTDIREAVPMWVFAYLGGMLIHADDADAVAMIAKHRAEAAAFIKEHGLENLIAQRVYSPGPGLRGDADLLRLWILHRDDEGGGK